MSEHGRRDSSRPRRTETEDEINDGGTLVKGRRFQKASSYPDEQLCDDHVSHGAGQVQCGTSISVAVRLVDLFFGAVGQEENHQPQVVLHHGPQELLSQRHV